MSKNNPEREAMYAEQVLHDCRAFVFMMRATHGPGIFASDSIETDAQALAKVLYPNGTDLPAQQMEPHGPETNE